MKSESPDAASAVPPLTQALIAHLESEPWRYGFIALMRRINANMAIDPVGTAALATTETFRLGQKPSLIFAPREIADATLRDGRLRIRLFSLGMLGPNGPLPIHVTEIAREREESRRDPTLCNFLDIFHHRSLSLMFRAWKWSQSAVSLDRADDDHFSFYIASLVGDGRRRERPCPLASHARLSAAPHLVRRSRNPDGLRATLAHFFGVPVAIKEFELHWMTIEPGRESRFGGDRMSSCLAMGATLGQVVPDRRHRFRIVLGPLDIEQYHRFTPQGGDLLKLIEWVRVFTGREYSWELELQLKPQSATPAVMGGPLQLGWSSWLGHSPEELPIAGMRFEPENYVRKLRQTAAQRTNTLQQSV
ncbi:type VI secretion system baseplate subunit TssG [Paraburkholderia bannensis]|nr:type VI secretion system baseplate subunit TssG [Paraburkholderia bannensis]RQM44676.1 type VI secretion system baseplate subunit TssG [Paraburkholderia bannensis]